MDNFELTRTIGMLIYREMRFEYEKDYKELVSFIENDAEKLLNVFINSIYKNYQ